MRKRTSSRALSIALILSLSLIVMPTVSQARVFSDSADAGPQFITYIEDLATRGIVSGSGGNFHPNNAMTRGELAKIVVGAAQLPLASTGAQQFSDVAPGNDFLRAHSDIGTKRHDFWFL